MQSQDGRYDYCPPYLDEWKDGGIRAGNAVVLNWIMRGRIKGYTIEYKSLRRWWRSDKPNLRITCNGKIVENKA